MAKAIWNGRVVAQSDDTVVVDGNHYFPADSVDQSLLEESDKTTRCGWKGTANYYTINVDGQRNEDAAWVYRSPKAAAKQLKDHLAFWGGVTVED